MYSRVLPSDTGNRRDPYPVLWTPNAELCFTLNLETKAAHCRLLGKSPAPLWEHVEHTTNQAESMREYRSIALNVTRSSSTFTAHDETAPGAFLGDTARSAQLSLTTGDSSFPPLSRWRWSTLAQGWTQATRERREPLSSALKQRWVSAGLSRLLGSPPAQPKRREGSIDATSRPRVHSRHPARFPLKGSLEFLSQPFLFYTWLCTGRADCKMKAREGGLRSEVHLFGLLLPRSSEDTLCGSPRGGHPPGSHGMAEHGGTRSRHGEAAPQRATAPGQSVQTKPRLPSQTSRVSCFGHMDICPVDNGLGQTGHTGRILTGDVELDGSAGHQLCPEQKMNYTFLFSHGFHPDPLCTWSQ